MNHPIDQKLKTEAKRMERDEISIILFMIRIQQYTMRKNIHVLQILIAITLTTISQQIDCNFTHFEFYSKFSLGKQQQLNHTFDQILPYIKIPTISYKASDFLSFNLTDFKIRFTYLDSNQYSVIIGNDTVGVLGGKLEINVDFKWVAINMVANYNGTATARMITDEISFEKLLQIDQGYLDYKLAFYYKMDFDLINFALTRIDPATTSDNDTQNILKALNVGGNQTQSLKKGLQKQINDYYPTFLSRNLKNQHYPLDDHFDYTWYNNWSKTNISIPFMLVPTGVDLQPIGLSLTFVSFIKDYANWKCGKAIPHSQLSPQIYGGLQEFISFSVFQNTIAYALEKGLLNTNLNRINWQSRFFQFYAGDLYEVIPEIASKYLASEKVQGNCTYSPKQITVKKHNNTVISSSTYHNCALFISSLKIAEFQINLRVKADIHPNETHLNFKIIEAEGTPVFKPVTGYEVKNKQLAEHMIMHSLNRLKEGQTFGSGWKIYPRDYAHIMLQDDFITIYDSTHVQLAVQ